MVLDVLQPEYAAGEIPFADLRIRDDPEEFIQEAPVDQMHARNSLPASFTGVSDSC